MRSSGVLRIRLVSVLLLVLLLGGWEAVPRTGKSVTLRESWLVPDASGDMKGRECPGPLWCGGRVFNAVHGGHGARRCANGASGPRR